jgi:UDP-N-acetylglucosamine acyltransferase
MSIHPTAIIEKGAKLASDVTVGAYAYIGAQVTIGEGCSIGHHATVDGKTTLGKKNKLHPYAYIGGPTQDLKFAGGSPELFIGNDNTFREFTTVNCGTVEAIPTRIGNGNLFLTYTHVAHECDIGHHNIFSNSVQIAGHVTIADFNVVGGLTGIHQFVNIGSYCMVGGASGLTKDLPPFMIGQGNHAVLAGFNKVGMERAGFSQEEIEDAFRAFKIFRRRHTFENIPKYLQEQLNPEGRVFKMLVEFLGKSKRGIVGVEK